MATTGTTNSNGSNNTVSFSNLTDVEYVHAAAKKLGECIEKMQTMPTLSAAYPLVRNWYLNYYLKLTHDLIAQGDELSLMSSGERDGLSASVDKQLDLVIGGKPYEKAVKDHLASCFLCPTSSAANKPIVLANIL